MRWIAARLTEQAFGRGGIAQRRQQEVKLARGFRSQMNVITMHQPNEPGYSRPGLYVLDDWR